MYTISFIETLYLVLVHDSSYVVFDRSKILKNYL